MYIIKRDDGKLVSDSTKSNNSYTDSIIRAKIFDTIEEAARNLCPLNERIVDIGYNDILRK